MKRLLLAGFMLLFCGISTIHSQSTLWSMTSSGGSAGVGTIIKIMPDGSNFSTAYNFPATGLNGTLASESLIKLANGKFYGMTSHGGINNGGVLFSFQPDSGIFTRLHAFAANSRPAGNLIQANDGKLYGMTSGDDNLVMGTIFSYDLATATISVLFVFNGAASGNYPLGSLLQASNGKLYGMTSKGGVSDKGVLFSYDIVTGNVTKHVDFTGLNGQQPYGSLMQANNGLLYGLTSLGGTGNGVIFSFNPSTNIYTKLHDCSPAAGEIGTGSLIQATNGKLYGLFSQGGNGNGVLFSFNPVGNVYTLLYSFITFQGSQPGGSLYQAANGKLYGLTTAGGSFDWGTIFNYDINTSTFTKLRDLNNADGIFPRQSNFVSSEITMATGSVSTNVCAGSSINVPYTVSASFNAGNVFTAQLSNASGSFASPVNIGTLSATSYGTIAAVIPMGTTTGTGYRIRVIASNPAITGTENGTNISIEPFTSLLFIEGMGSVASNTAISTHETNNGFNNDGLTMTGTGQVSNSSQSNSYAGASGGANILLSNTNFQIAGINTTGLTGLQISFGAWTSNVISSTDLEVSVSSDGINYTNLFYPSFNSFSWYYRMTSGTIPATANLRIRFTGGFSQFRVDDIKLIGNYSSPGITGSTQLCNGNSVILSASPSLAYLWNNNAVSGSINVNSAGNYNCLMTSENGCELLSNTINITDATPLPFNVTGGGMYCASGTPVAVGLSGSQTGTNYQLRLNNSNTGSPVAGTGNAISFGNQTTIGTYTVFATHIAAGCTDTMQGNAVIVADPLCPLSGIYCIGPSASYTPPSGGAYINGASPFARLTDAISALNTLGASSHVIFELQNNYISSLEIFPLSITYQGTVSTTVVFRPRSDVPAVLNIIGSVDTTARALIKYIGADYVTFDGSPGGIMGTAKNILVRNTNISSTVGSTFYFANDATHNTLNALKLEDGANSFNVYIGGTTGTTGNDFITIQNCELRNRTDIVSYPSKQIYANGAASGNAANSNVVLSANYISNAINGIDIQGGNNGSWTISGNHVYSTVNSVFSITEGIRLSIANDTCTAIITGNYIGGTAPFAGGTPMIPYFNHSAFNAVYLLCPASTSVSTLSNNVIANINVPNSSFKQVWGLNITGPVNVLDNIIGDANTLNSINFGLSSVVNFVGINYSSPSTLPVSISNNVIQNITFQNPDLGGAGNFSGISYINIATHTGTFNNNVIKNINSNSRGSLIMMNVRGGIASGAATHISNNKIETISQTNAAGNGGFHGIICMQSNAIITGNRIGRYNVANDIVNASAASSFGIFLNTNKSDSVAFDTIANITFTNTANTAFFAISQYSSSNISSHILNNVISEIKIASSLSSTESDEVITYALCGIHFGPTDNSSKIANNIVKGLHLTNTGAVNPAVAGIGGTSITNTVISENRIYDLTNVATNTASLPLIFGIKFNSPSLMSINNNMISLSNAGNNNAVRIYGIYDNSSNFIKSYNYNSIALTGYAYGNARSAAFWRNAVASSHVSLRNNIFYNTRTGGTGKHYAIVNETGSSTNWTSTASNYNNLYSSDASSLGRWGIADKTFSAWKSISGGDANSANTNVTFTDFNSDLHVSSAGNCALNGTGTNVSGVPSDYDAEIRHASTPDIGADEFDEASAALNVTLLVEGYFAGGNSLTPVLFNAGVSADPTHCDSVTIELHHSATPFNLAYAKTALLKTNGTITCELPCNYLLNNYYLVVKTRNAIETWSKQPISISLNTVFDFMQ